MGSIGSIASGGLVGAAAGLLGGLFKGASDEVKRLPADQQRVLAANAAASLGGGLLTTRTVLMLAGAGLAIYLFTRK